MSALAPKRRRSSVGLQPGKRVRCRTYHPWLRRGLPFLLAKHKDVAALQRSETLSTLQRASQKRLERSGIVR